jgi:hypothetical protein
MFPTLCEFSDFDENWTTINNQSPPLLKFITSKKQHYAKKGKYDKNKNLLSITCKDNDFDNINNGIKKTVKANLILLKSGDFFIYGTKKLEDKFYYASYESGERAFSISDNNMIHLKNGLNINLDDMSLLEKNINTADFSTPEQEPLITYSSDHINKGSYKVHTKTNFHQPFNLNGKSIVSENSLASITGENFQNGTIITSNLEAKNIQNMLIKTNFDNGNFLIYKFEGVNQIQKSSYEISHIYTNFDEFTKNEYGIDLHKNGNTLQCQQNILNVYNSNILKSKILLNSEKVYLLEKKELNDIFIIFDGETKIYLDNKADCDLTLKSSTFGLINSYEFELYKTSSNIKIGIEHENESIISFYGGGLGDIEIEKCGLKSCFLINEKIRGNFIVNDFDDLNQLICINSNLNHNFTLLLLKDKNQLLRKRILKTEDNIYIGLSEHKVKLNPEIAIPEHVHETVWSKSSSNFISRILANSKEQLKYSSAVKINLDGLPNPKMTAIDLNPSYSPSKQEI